MKNFKKITSIDEYIGTFPENIQDILEALRQAIRESAPNAEETINYQMPTFKLNGNLVHFAAHKEHIGFYPTPSGITAFINELEPFKFSNGTIQFPLGQPLPIALVKKIVRFKVKENLKR